MKDRALHLKGGPELRGVGKIAVVRQRHMALLMVHLNGLAVIPVRAAGGTVAGMPHRHGSRR